MNSRTVGSVSTRAGAALVAGLLLVCVRVSALTITEIMYNPGAQKDHLEYIEIYNETTDPIDLTGFRFTRGVVFTFRERLFLNGDKYLVVCANEDAIREAYDIENTIGNWLPATFLADGGETIEISNEAGVVQARVRYNDRGKWPGGADGTGHSLEIESPWKDQDDPDSWSISAVLGGSPGEANDTVSGKLPVVINEALLNAPPADRFLELYNKGLEEVDLSGFHFTTNPADLSQVKLVGDVVVPPRGYLAFDGAELGLDFTPDDEGKVFVALVNATADRVISARTFKPRIENLSEARIPDGVRKFEDAADPTPGAANRTGAVQSVVINEIFYHHFDQDPDKEFVELYNRGEETVDVGLWKFNDGIRYAIPAGTTLGPDRYLVIARNPDYIRETYGLPDDRVLGPETEEAREAFGVLANAGERVTLADELDRIVDSVRYYDGGNWPGWADGEGSSLELIDPYQDNSVALAWDASDDSEKSEVREFSYMGTFFGATEQELHFLLVGRGIALVDDIVMTSREIVLQTIEPYVDFGAGWKFLKGTEPPPAGWTEENFDDAGWLEGPTPIGYARTFDGATELADMKGNYISVFFRKEITIDSLDGLTNLVVEIDYDDGFVFYVNGVELAALNMDDGREFDVEASGSGRRDPHQIVLKPEEIAASPFKPGRNVLAVQMHNRRLTNSDFLFDCRVLDGRFVTVDGDNLVRDGDFEADNKRGNARWPAQDTNRYWVFEGNHVRSGVTRKETLEGSGSLKIVATGRGDNKVNRIETSNSGLSGLTMRQDYNIAFKAKWIAGAPTLLTHGAYTNPQGPPNYAVNHLLHVPANLGTPGAVNSATRRQIERTGSANTGPVIWKVKQSPVVPAANESVTVRAKVSDPDGVESVKVYYTLDTAKEEDDPDVSAVSMEDPDGDGLYEAVIPPHSTRNYVLFWIIASDKEGRTGRFPADDLERTHPLKLDPENAVPADLRQLVYRHDTVRATRSLSYRFWMDKGKESFLQSRRLHSNEHVYGSFIFENSQIHYNSEIRFVGSPFVRTHFRSYRVRIPKDDQLWGRIKKFNLEDHQNNGGDDGRERISHYLFRHNGAPYSDLWLATSQVNDRTRNRQLEHYTTPSREFLSLWFPGDDTGPFYEVDDRFNISDAGTRSGNANAHVRYPPYPPHGPLQGEDKEYYRYFFNSRGGNPFDDFTDLIAFAKVMTPGVTDDDSFDQQIWEHADVEEIFRIWSIRLNTGDWDTWGARRGKNCYLYKPEIGGLWNLIGWDMELTYESNDFMPPRLTARSNPIYNQNIRFPEVVRWLNRPVFKRLYYGIMADMIDADGPFSREFLTAYDQRLRAAGVNSRNALNFVNSRRSALRSATRGVTSESVDFEITTPNPHVSANPLVTIEGKAPVDIRSIGVVVDGERPDAEGEARFASDDVLGWNYTTTLSGGNHTLTFVGFGFDDQEVASVSLEVSVTTTPFVRGDTDGSGKVAITDAIQTLLFIAGRAFPSCADAMDSDDSGTIEITDAIVTLEYLFLSGPPLKPPFPRMGADPTEDDLGCEKGPTP